MAFSGKEQTTAATVAGSPSPIGTASPSGGSSPDIVVHPTASGPGAVARPNSSSPDAIVSPPSSNSSGAATPGSTASASAGRGDHKAFTAAPGAAADAVPGAASAGTPRTATEPPSTPSRSQRDRAMRSDGYEPCYSVDITEDELNDSKSPFGFSPKVYEEIITTPKAFKHGIYQFDATRRSRRADQLDTAANNTSLWLCKKGGKYYVYRHPNKETPDKSYTLLDANDTTRYIFLIFLLDKNRLELRLGIRHEGIRGEHGNLSFFSNAFIVGNGEDFHINSDGKFAWNSQSGTYSISTEYTLRSLSKVLKTDPNILLETYEGNKFYSFAVIKDLTTGQHVLLPTHFEKEFNATQLPPAERLAKVGITGGFSLVSSLVSVTTVVKKGDETLSSWILFGAPELTVADVSVLLANHFQTILPLTPANFAEKGSKRKGDAPAAPVSAPATPVGTPSAAAPSVAVPSSRGGAAASVAPVISAAPAARTAAPSVGPGSAPSTPLLKHSAFASPAMAGQRSGGASTPVPPSPACPVVLLSGSPAPDFHIARHPDVSKLYGNDGKAVGASAASASAAPNKPGVASSAALLAITDTARLYGTHAVLFATANNSTGETAAADASFGTDIVITEDPLHRHERSVRHSGN